MASVARLLPWVKRLTNLDPARCEDALVELRSWKLKYVERELLEEPDLDTIVAAVLLAESVRDLSAQGVPKTKLLKKLRDAKSTEDFWPVWAEIRSAALLIAHPDSEARLEMETHRARGRHADFRLVEPSGLSVEIEFKAISLSDAEVAWHRQASERFEELLPPVGLSTLHGWLDRPMAVDQRKRDKAWKRSRKLDRDLRRLAPTWSKLRGVAIVGRETEADYVRRVCGRIEEALGQLSTDEECWVALWWVNGAPLQATQGLLRQIDAPPNVAGLVFIGQAIAVPWSEISVFISSIDREVEFDGTQVDSTVDDELAKLVLDRFESSSGVRPTLLRAPGKNGLTLLKRNGRRRIMPFNLLFDADPRQLAPPSRPPSPVQDTPYIQ